MLGGGYVAYNEMKKNEIKTRETNLAGTQGLHIFTECDYKPQEMGMIGDNLPKDENDESVISMMDGIRSFVVTDGYKIDTYADVDLTGTKMTYSGPQNMRCLANPIKSLKFYKA
jgi:hypothetical protein